MYIIGKMFSQYLKNAMEVTEHAVDFIGSM
jgi:hypothetical protein